MPFPRRKEVRELEPYLERLDKLVSLLENAPSTKLQGQIFQEGEQSIIPLVLAYGVSPNGSIQELLDDTGKVPISRLAGITEIGSDTQTGDTDATVTIPSGQVWEVMSYFFSFEADANVASRVITPSYTINSRTTALTTAPQMTGSTITATAGEPIYIWQAGRSAQRWQSDANVESLVTSQPTFPQYAAGLDVIKLAASNRQVGDKSAISVYGTRIA